MATAWIRTASSSRSAAAFAATLSCVTPSVFHVDSNTSCQSDALKTNQPPKPPTTTHNATGSKLIFLGTGSSTGCPRPLCTMLFGSHPPIEFNSPQSDKLSTWLHEQLSYCQVSNLAIQRNPKDNHDYRNNPSLLISHCIQEKEDDQTSTTCQNIVIDVGKTFREGALRWFPENGISSLDAIVLTHHHMDAVGGLDDVRGFQRVGFPAATTTRTTSTKEPTKNSSALPVHLQPSQLPSPTRVSIPVFLSQECLDQVSSQFPWLFPKQRQLPPPSSTNANASSSSESRPLVPRDVAALDIHVIDENLQPFQVTEGLTMVPLPVWHGDDLISLGFAFSIPNRSPSTVMSTTIGDVEQPTTNVVYISDVSRMIPETLDYILNKLPQPTHILVVDALLTGDRTHPVHYNLEQAVALVKTIKPRQAYLVGMSCDSFLPHEKMNQVLREKYGNIQLAHDGLVIEL